MEQGCDGVRTGPTSEGSKRCDRNTIKNDSLSPDPLLVESTDSLRGCVLRRTNSACALVPTGERTRTLHSSFVVDARGCVMSDPPYQS